MYTGPLVGTVIKGSGCGACGPANNAQANCSNLGPEYSYSGYSNCGECSFNCWGSLCTTGARPKCMKNSYQGDRLSCCQGLAPPGYPNVTCDPSWTVDSPTCRPLLQSLCSPGLNIFTKPICRQWASNNPNLAFTIKKQACTIDQIKNNPECRKWVMSSGTQGKIDTIMVGNFCQKYPTDPLCNCVLSQIPCPNKFDMNCISKGGYKTADMENVQCPNVLNCNQFLSLSPGAQAVATNIQQHCKSSITNNSGGQTSNSVQHKSNSSAISTNSSSLYLIIFLIILVVAAVLFIIYRKVRSARKINPNVR